MIRVAVASAALVVAALSSDERPAKGPGQSMRVFITLTGQRGLKIKGTSKVAGHLDQIEARAFTALPANPTAAKSLRMVVDIDELPLFLNALHNGERLDGIVYFEQGQRPSDQPYRRYQLKIQRAVVVDVALSHARLRVTLGSAAALEFIDAHGAHITTAIPTVTPLAGTDHSPPTIEAEIHAKSKDQIRSKDPARVPGDHLLQDVEWVTTMPVASDGTPSGNAFIHVLSLTKVDTSEMQQIEAARTSHDALDGTKVKWYSHPAGGPPIETVVLTLLNGRMDSVPVRRANAGSGAGRTGTGNAPPANPRLLAITPRQFRVESLVLHWIFVCDQSVPACAISPSP